MEQGTGTCSIYTKKFRRLITACGFHLLFYTFFFSYFNNIFAFLQMYIASIAATATTAIEIIVNIIIFSFLNFLNLKCYPNLFFIPLLFRGSVILLTMQRYDLF